MTQNGQELSEICSIFVLEESEHPSSPHRLMGLIAPSFLGTARHPGFTPGCSPFPSWLGATQVSGGLALSSTYYSNIYLEFKTTLRSFGEGLATLTLGLGGINPITVCATGERSIRPFRHLFYWYKWNKLSQSGPTLCNFWPPTLGGVKIAKITIVSDRIVRLFRLLGYLI